ncbi:long-chain fatty acid-CoA ligase [Rhodotorula mucilaginosa]|uniref:Long-chain fatty acid-CoA ligase n=1 Tax=Rhodotorula mucilaginosa TaxID=5537 RepID=A0A9P7B5J0_RHOMI|nr:long-chain fatty acid-CoA ligase [Rhodotorula mucilaginosa]
MAQMQTVEIGDEQLPPGQGRPRRYYMAKDGLVDSPGPGIRVIPDMLDHSVKVRPDAPAVGWRDTINIHKEYKDVKKVIDGQETTEKKEWTYYELTDYRYLSYAELGQLVADLASALVETGHSRDTVFNIYAQTSMHWFAMANACAKQGITFATAYDSLGEDGLEHSLNEPGVCGMFTNSNLLGTLAAVITRTPTVKTVIYDGPSNDIKPADAIEKLQQAGVRVLHWDEFVQLGKDKKHEVVKRPEPDDVACIMYTSGSTGAPKGVEITHGQVVAIVGGTIKLVSHLITPDARAICYLPLSHIFELALEFTVLYAGVPMGYGTVKTLTDTSMRNCVGDMRAFGPTIMTGVPTVWELIRKGILQKVSSGPAYRASLFHGALGLKRWTKSIPIVNTLVGGVLDTVVFKAVKQATGGKLKYAINGGAGVSQATQEFLSYTLTPYFIQGYGLTETTALSCILPPQIVQIGVVGVPNLCNEIQLRDFDEAGYKADGSGEHAKGRPQGEVCLRGPNVFKGYYKREDLTKEALTDDGWFLTGDIGQWNEDGTLSIIDRKKNLIKLQGGEYIALERLESIYKSCNLVLNIAVHADSNASRPMAIIVPHEHNLRQLLAAEPELLGPGHKNVDDLDWATEVCQNDKVRKRVLAELNATGKQAKLKRLESLQTVILSDVEWTPQNGFLTAAQKLQRKTILNHFKAEIDKIYP